MKKIERIARPSVSLRNAGRNEPCWVRQRQEVQKVPLALGCGSKGQTDPAAATSPSRLVGVLRWNRYARGEQALKIFALWAAYATFEESLRGSIEPGKWADFTVLSQDILKIPEAEIPKTTCRMTVVNGEVVYRAPETHPAIAQP